MSAGDGASRETRAGGKARGAAVVVVVVALVGAVWAVVAHRAAERPVPIGPRRATSMPDGPSVSGARSMSDSERRPPGTDRSATLTADQIRTFGVLFDTAGMRVLGDELRTIGTVLADESRMVQVPARVGGYVERLYVNVTGQPVRRGQPMLELSAPDLVAAEQELLLAAGLQRSVGESAVPGLPANTSDLVAAARRRLALWGVADAEVSEILRSGRVRRTLTLHAPASGVVVERRVVQGQAVTPGEVLYTIADLSRVTVEAALRELDAASVRVGSGADIDVAGLTGRTFKGRVAYVYPTVESATRTVRARIGVANGDGALKPGMYATVRLTTPSRTALAVPASAVVRTGDGTVVFVDAGQGRLVPQTVTLGRVAGAYAEVLSGIRRGQRVVTSAQYLLDAESNLGETMKGMIGAGGGQEMGHMPGMEMKGADTRGMPGMPGMPMPNVPPRARRPR